jgi:hypothetical protein
MSDDDPVDVHRALQKAARELAHYADNGSTAQYLDAIDNLEGKLQAVRQLPAGSDTEMGLAPAMTLEQIARAVDDVRPAGADVEALQIVMLGRDLAEVKARAGGEWYQGIVSRDVWGDKAP